MMGLIQWSPGISLAALERQAILAAFQFYKGNKTATAHSLGIAIRTLDERLKKYEIDTEDETKAAEERRLKNEEFLARSRGLSPAGQFDHAASQPLPEPENGLKPEGWEPPKTTNTKSPLPSVPKMEDNIKSVQRESAQQRKRRA